MSNTQKIMLKYLVLRVNFLPETHPFPGKKFFQLQTHTYYTPIDQKCSADSKKGQDHGMKIFLSRDLEHFRFRPQFYAQLLLSITAVGKPNLFKILRNPIMLDKHKMISKLS